MYQRPLSFLCGSVAGLNREARIDVVFALGEVFGDKEGREQERKWIKYICSMEGTNV